MKNIFLSFVLAALAAMAAFAQNSAPAAASEDHTAPSYDLKGQALLDLETIQ